MQVLSKQMTILQVTRTQSTHAPFRLSRTMMALAATGACLLTLGTQAMAQATPDAMPPSDGVQSAMTPYVLTPDDQLDIAVQGHDELRLSVSILPDGTFNYPILHTVHAAGMTVDQLTRYLTKGLSGEVNQPEVTVSVRQSRTRAVSVLGAVSKPGLYDYKPGWHLLEALAAAGGPLQAPELTQITVVQATTNKTTAVDDVKLMSGADSSENAALEPGDVVMVAQRDPALAQAQVIGDVAKPGAYSVPTGGESVLSLITAAGGSNPTAALNRVQIMHQGHVQDLDLSTMTSNLDATALTQVVPGDVLLIPANTAKIAVLGAVTMPAAYLVPDGKSITVAGALTLAGGPTSLAVKREARIARSGPNGQVTTTEIDIDKMLKGDSTIANMQLQPGDILYIPSKGENNSSTFLNPFAALLGIALK